MCVLISGTLLMCMGFIFVFNSKEVTHNFTLLLLKHIQDPLAAPVGPCGCFLLPEEEERKKCYLVCGRSQGEAGGKTHGQKCPGRMTVLCSAIAPLSVVCTFREERRFPWL